MSDTPRTDAAEDGDHNTGWVPAAFARELERELRSIEHIAVELDHLAARDRALAESESGVVGFGVTAAFAAAYANAAVIVRARGRGLK